MARSPLAAVAVALLLATAGCSGFGGGTTRTPYDVGAHPTPTPTETPTPTPTATPTPTETATATPAPVRAPPELVARLRGQERLVGGVASYTLRVTRNVTIGENAVLLTNVSCRVALDSDRGICRQSYGHGETREPRTTVVYRGEGLLQSRRTDAGEPGRRPTQRAETAPVNTTLDVLGEWARRLELAALEADGTATFDGEEMTRYTAFDPVDAPPSGEDLTEYRLVVLVDDRGLVRYVEERRVESVGTRTTWHVAVTDVGSTTVGRPDWVGNGTVTTARVE
jgi:hypothetical protein